MSNSRQTPRSWLRCSMSTAPGCVRPTAWDLPWPPACWAVPARRGRFASAAAYANYTGTAPVQIASAGSTRHRLSRYGDRQLNSAIYTIAVIQIRMPASAGRAYYERRPRLLRQEDRRGEVPTTCHPCTQTTPRRTPLAHHNRRRNPQRTNNFKSSSKCLLTNREAPRLCSSEANWSRGHTTCLNGLVVGFAPPLDRWAVREISTRYQTPDERVAIADLRPQAQFCPPQVGDLNPLVLRQPRTDLAHRPTI